MFIVLFLVLYVLGLIMIAWGGYYGKKEGCIDLSNTAYVLGVVFWPIWIIYWLICMAVYYIDNRS